MDTFIYSWMVFATLAVFFFRKKPFAILIVVGASCFLNYALLDADIPAVKVRKVAFALSTMFFLNLALTVSAFLAAWFSYRKSKLPEGVIDLSQDDGEIEIIRAEPEPEPKRKKQKKKKTKQPEISKKPPPKITGEAQGDGSTNWLKDAGNEPSDKA